MNYKEKKEELLKKIEEFTESIDQMHQSLNDLIEEENKEEFVTVVDGWRGSLFLKKCWVREEIYEKWMLMTNVELVLRGNNTGAPFMFICKNQGIFQYPFLKFRPFSPENPPSVDWPCDINNGSRAVRYFKEFGIHGEVKCYNYGATSMNGGFTTAWGHVKFLNIEPVED